MWIPRLTERMIPWCNCRVRRAWNSGKRYKAQKLFDASWYRALTTDLLGRYWLERRFMENRV